MSDGALSLRSLILACMPFDSGVETGRRKLIGASQIVELLDRSPRPEAHGLHWRTITSELRSMNHSTDLVEYHTFGTSGNARRQGLMGWRLGLEGAFELGYFDAQRRTLLLEAEGAYLLELRPHSRTGADLPEPDDWSWTIPLRDRLVLRGFIERREGLPLVRLTDEGRRALHIFEKGHPPDDDDLF